jgi:hypothetical protein
MPPAARPIIAPVLSLFELPAQFMLWVLPSSCSEVAVFGWLATRLPIEGGDKVDDVDRDCFVDRFIVDVFDIGGKVESEISDSSGVEYVK